MFPLAGYYVTLQILYATLTIFYPYPYPQPKPIFIFSQDHSLIKHPDSEYMLTEIEFCTEHMFRTYFSVLNNRASCNDIVDSVMKMPLE